MHPVAIRGARDDDGPALIALIGAVFHEYPHCILDVDGEAPELRAIATTFDSAGGHFWVAERSGHVAGCVGFTPAHTAGGIELRKLYVAKDARRVGLGNRLCELIESEAHRRTAAFIELWSDTRFLDAHRLYEKRGYRRGPQTRALHDISASVEYSYRKDL
jgi:putative acetyltransferase